MQLISMDIDRIRLIMHCKICLVFIFHVIDWLLGTYVLHLLVLYAVNTQLA